MGIVTTMRRALRAHLYADAALDALPCQQERPGFARPAPTLPPNTPARYLRETLKPLADELASIGPNCLLRKRVLLLVDVYEQEHDGGPTWLDDTADALVARFAVGLDLVAPGGQVLTIERADREAALPTGDGWLMVPVAIQAVAATANAV